MLKLVTAKVHNYLYDKDTGYMLNYLTLNVKDKLIEKDIASERAERIYKVYWFIFTCSLVAFILQIYQLLINTVEINILIAYLLFFTSVIILGITRCRA